MAGGMILPGHMEVQIPLIRQRKAQGLELSVAYYMAFFASRTSDNTYGWMGLSLTTRPSPWTREHLDWKLRSGTNRRQLRLRSASPDYS